MSRPAGQSDSRRPRGFDIEPLDEPTSAPPKPASGPEPAPSSSAEPSSPAELMIVAGEFRTAAAALVFAGGLPDIGEVTFGREEATGSWWAGAELTLPTARELVVAAGGRLWIDSDRGVVADQGWGDRPPTESPPRDDIGINDVAVLDVLRAAGLHQVCLPVPDEVTVLLPALPLAAVVQRALDLGVAVTYGLIRLESLFGDADPPRTVFELRLTSPGGLPGGLLTALSRDPFVLVCRRPAKSLLVQYGFASPLPDRALAVLAADAGGWLLAGIGFGSARICSLGEPQDAASLVRLDDRHRLVGIDDNWARTGEETLSVPELPPLQLIRARTPRAVDAALLVDEDLDCLPVLLEGRPLADVAQFIRGRDRHLLLAAGGLLERLPVGEPLYRLGPGPLYLPLGYRMQPVLPPSARAELLMTEADTAVVLEADSAFSFPLQRQEPVWLLWAGALPPVDRQLPPDARAALAEIDRFPASAPPSTATPTSRPGEVKEKLAEGHTSTEQTTSPSKPRSWRDDARDAELADDFVRAAELFERHGELLRAAHMYELAACRDAETQPAARSAQQDVR